MTLPTRRTTRGQDGAQWVLRSLLLAIAATVVPPACDDNRHSPDDDDDDDMTVTDIGGQGGDGGSAGQGGNAATDDQCEAYLSCLLQASPESYAAALALYGAESACWDTPEQAAACEQACEALLVDYGDRCECAGSECVLCTDKLSYLYDSEFSENGWLVCDDGERYQLNWFRLLFEYGQGRELTADLSEFVFLSPDLHGTHPCGGGSFDVAGTVAEGAYSEQWTLSLSPADDAQTLSASVTITQNFTSGHSRVCTTSANFVLP